MEEEGLGSAAVTAVVGSEGEGMGRGGGGEGEGEGRLVVVVVEEGLEIL